MAERKHNVTILLWVTFSAHYYYINSDTILRRCNYFTMTLAGELTW